MWLSEYNVSVDFSDKQLSESNAKYTQTTEGMCLKLYQRHGCNITSYRKERSSPRQSEVLSDNKHNHTSFMCEFCDP